MSVKKWNTKNNEYEPYTLPEGARLIADLDDIISCAACAKKVTFGESYTSRFIHSPYGLGFAVCEDCYFKEE